MNKFEFKNLTPFKWFVLENFPFIEADFDALTNWQLFCKIGKEINKIIDTTNTLGTQVETMTTSFNALKEYVENYFKNLDVQEEINNKLDEMAEDGTLEKIIEKYVAHYTPRIFNNVDSMKKETLENENYAMTLGYYQANDGGGALYYVVSTKPSNGYYETLNNGNYAILISTNNEINIKQFGCKVDGTTDDTLALKNAIENLNSNGFTNYTLVIPGITVISDTITISTSGVTLKGNNINRCGIKCVGTNAYIKFGGLTTKIYEIDIKDLFVRGDYTQSQLILFDKCFNIYLHRVYLNQINNNNYLIKFVNGSGIVYITECILDSSEDVENYPSTANAIYFEKMDSIFDMKGCNCWNLNKLLDFRNTTLQVNVHNNWIECCRQLFYITDVTDLRYMNLNIENNTFNLHKYSNFDPGETNIIKIDGTSSTNAYNSYIKLINNNIYLWDTTLENSTLINIPLVQANSKIYIVYNGNVMSGKTLNDLQSYVCYINTTLTNTIKIAEANINSRLESVWLTNLSTSILSIIRNETNIESIVAPNGLYLNKTNVINNGNITYDSTTNKFYCGYGGTLRQLPQRVGTKFPYVTTETDLVSYINDFVTAIVQSGIIDREV